MEMTERYTAWLLALYNRDVTLVKLSLIALALVAAWALLPTIDERLRVWLARAFMLGGMVLYIFMLIRSFQGQI